MRSDSEPAKENRTELSPSICCETTNCKDYSHFYYVWKFLDKGANNNAYVDRTRKWVLKIPKKDNLLDEASRAARIFNEINPTIKRQAKVLGRGWVSPYIDGKQAKPLKEVSYIFKLYAATGRLLLDGHCQRNLLEERSTGRVVCIDPGNIVRSNSIASQLNWYSSTKESANRRETFKRHWVEKVTEFQLKKAYLYALPILMTLGLYSYDRKVAFDLNSLKDMRNYLNQNIIFAYGVFMYFYYFLIYFKKNALNSELATRIIYYLFNCKDRDLLTEPWDFYVRNGENASYNYIKSLSDRDLVYINEDELLKLSASFFSKNDIKNSKEDDNLGLKKSENSTTLKPCQ